MTEGQTPAGPRRPPRPIAWLLLLASACAALMTGLVATAFVLSQAAPWSTPLEHPGFWIWLIVACGLTAVSLGLRALRWIFLLRRSETRIPIRDAYIGYLAGLSLLLAPLLLGETVLRAYLHRERGRVPVAVTAVLNIWERCLDAVALAAIGGVLALASRSSTQEAVVLLSGVAAAMLPPVRRICLRLVGAIVAPFARMTGDGSLPRVTRLAGNRTWFVTFATSVLAWILPGLGYWGLAASWGTPYGLAQAQRAYTGATLAGGFLLAPGGIVVAGGRLLDDLQAAGFSVQAAALSVMGIRLATAGMSTAFGVLFLFLHFRSRPVTSDHFDEIADSYDVQIPLARRLALLTRKTVLMRELLTAHGAGRSGLDVGCGQGWYVARMRELGFDVSGIDASPGQVALAARHVGGTGLVRVGSALAIPAADASCDFVYSINVLHHLPSVEHQRAAFVELVRVLRPGGLLFVHEINTRNVLFRFYMGYVFPSLNCIDEGVERWLLPHRLDAYADVPVIDVRYFTFLPEFLPSGVIRLFAPLERRLEASRFKAYSAHYMAVLQKPA